MLKFAQRFMGNRNNKVTVEVLTRLVSNSERNVQERLKRNQETALDNQKTIIRLLQSTNQKTDRNLLPSDNHASSDNVDPCEHVKIISKFYTQLHHNLTRTAEIASMMLQNDKLTSAEHTEILQSNNIYTINDHLLKLMLNKSSDVYDCFVEALKEYQQNHLYQLLLTSGYDLKMGHAKSMRSDYIFLTENIQCEYMLEHLLADDVISCVEKEDIASETTSTRQTQKLLSLIAMKPEEMFPKFLKALELTGQAHVSRRLTKSSENAAVVPCNTAFTIEIKEALVLSPNPSVQPRIKKFYNNSVQNIDFHKRTANLHKDLVTLTFAKILIFRNRQGTLDPYLQHIAREATKFALIQPTLKVMKENIATFEQRYNDLWNDITDLRRVNDGLEFRVLNAEHKRNEFEYDVKQFKFQNLNWKDQPKKSVELLEKQIPGTNQGRNLFRKVQSSNMTSDKRNAKLKRSARLSIYPPPTNGASGISKTTEFDPYYFEDKSEEDIYIKEDESDLSGRPSPEMIYAKVPVPYERLTISAVDWTNSIYAEIHEDIQIPDTDYTSLDELGRIETIETPYLTLTGK